jgi:hypothetical protein
VLKEGLVVEVEVTAYSPRRNNNVWIRKHAAGNLDYTTPESQKKSRNLADTKPGSSCPSYATAEQGGTRFVISTPLKPGENLDAAASLTPADAAGAQQAGAAAVDGATPAA